jgi:tetratricopeptide (TPR) repeat protein
MNHHSTTSRVTHAIVLLSAALVLVAAGGARQLNKAAAAFSEGKIEKAEQLFHRAFAKAEKDGDTRGQARAYEGLGDVARQRGEVAAAIRHYKSSDALGSGDTQERQRVRAKSEALEDRVYQRFIDVAPERWEVYGSFIAENPSNHNVAEAARMRDALQYAPYRKEDTTAGYVTFIDHFPENRFTGTAMERVYGSWRLLDSEPYAAIRAYEKFLRLFPQSRLRAAAVILRGYYEALTASDLDAFVAFYEQSRQAPVPRLLDASAMERLQSALRAVVERTPTTDGYMLLYEKTRASRYLDRARDLVSDGDEEAYFVQLNPTAFFELGEAADQSEVGRQAEPFHKMVERYEREGGVGILLGIYLPETETTLKPVLEIPTRSTAEYGTYTVEVEFKLKVEMERRLTGAVTDFLKNFTQEPTSVSSTETYTTRVGVTLAPRTYKTVKVAFDEFTSNAEQSFAGLFGIEDRRNISDLEYKIHSVSRVDGPDSGTWSFDLRARPLPDFKRAARQFNAFVEETRSRQIDAMEERLVDGLVERLGGGGGP